MADLCCALCGRRHGTRPLVTLLGEPKFGQTVHPWAWQDEAPPELIRKRAERMHVPGPPLWRGEDGMPLFCPLIVLRPVREPVELWRFVPPHRAAGWTEFCCCDRCKPFYAGEFADWRVERVAVREPVGQPALGLEAGR